MLVSPARVIWENRVCGAVPPHCIVHTAKVSFVLLSHLTRPHSRSFMEFPTCLNAYRISDSIENHARWGRRAGTSCNAEYMGAWVVAASS